MKIFQRDVSFREEAFFSNITELGHQNAGGTHKYFIKHLAASLFNKINCSVQMKDNHKDPLLE